MELNNIPTIIILFILTGLIVGVGVLTLDKFADATYDSLVITNESFTVPAKDATVSLANGNITTFTQILNGSGSTWSTANYSIDLTTGVLNNTNNGTSCRQGDTCYAYYTYTEYDTSTGTTLRNARDDVGDVSNVWMSLIVTIVMLTVIMFLVLRGFAVSMKR